VRTVSAKAKTCASTAVAQW